MATVLCESKPEYSNGKQDAYRTTLFLSVSIKRGFPLSFLEYSQKEEASQFHDIYIFVIYIRHPRAHGYHSLDLIRSNKERILLSNDCRDSENTFPVELRQAVDTALTFTDLFTYPLFCV